MALASTGFMAAPGVWTDVLSTKLDKIDCSQVLAAVLKADKALLGHIKMGPTAHNIEINWIEDALNAIQIEGVSTVSGSIVVYGFTGSASLYNVCPEETIVTLKDGGQNSVDYYLKVSSVTGASTLITSVYGTTEWFTASVTAQWYVVTQLRGDHDTASDDISLARGKRKNFMQIFERGVEISQSRKGMDMEAVGSELQLQIKRRTLEIRRELDMAVINGQAYTDGTDFTADLDYRTMQGLVRYIRDYDLDGSLEDTTVTEGVGALTIGDLNGLLYKMWDAGGLDETADPIIVVGGTQQRVISGWESALRRVEQGERQVGYYRDIFLSDMGLELPIVLDRWMQTDKLMVLDRSRVAIRPLAGDSWHMEKMAKTGRIEKWQISGQYTIEMRNADSCHGLLLDLS